MSSGSSIVSKPTVAAMTGVGQRMPTQQAIILRPGQQSGLVTLPGGQSVRQPLVVSASGASIRVQGPGIQARANPGVGNRNVVINQSGGSQISVPLQALQSMQAGKSKCKQTLERFSHSLLFTFLCFNGCN